jgi:hypothetical protein
MYLNCMGREGGVIVVVDQMSNFSALSWTEHENKLHDVHFVLDQHA